MSEPTQPRHIGQANVSGKVVAVAVSGDYAYLADVLAGLQVMDLTRPAIPQRVAQFFDRVNSFKRVVVAEGHVYADNGGFLSIIDVTNPTLPKSQSMIPMDDTIGDISVLNNLMCVALDREGLQVFEIQSGTDPQLVGHLLPVRGSGFVAIALADGVAYMTRSRLNRSTLFVIDIKDPANPTLITSLSGLKFAADIAISGGHLYVADGSDGLRVFDIMNPAQPFQVASVETVDWVSTVFVFGHHAYLTDLHGKLEIIDVRDPTNPRPIGVFVHEEASQYAVPSKIVDVAVTNGIAYLAKESGGLLVLDVNNPAAPRLLGRNHSIFDATGVTVSGDQVYVANGSGGLVLFDTFRETSPRLGVSRLGDTIRIQWEEEFQGTLQRTDDSGAGWHDVDGAENPYAVEPHGARRFYRLRIGVR